MRLDSSFKGSYLQLSKRTLYIIGILTIIPAIFGPILSIVDNKRGACIAPWYPNDIQFDRDLTYCTLPVWSTFEDNEWIVILTVILWVLLPILNVSMGVIFSIKLKKLLSNHAGSEDIQFEFKSLIIKNSILTLIGVASTVICYTVRYGHGLC